MTRWLRVAGLVLVALLALGLLVTAFAVGTNRGARFVLDRAVPSADVGSIEGRLWGPIVLKDVHYAGPELEVRVARVRVEWRPIALLGRRLDITDLEVDTAAVVLLATGSSEADGDGGWARPSVPLAVDLGRFRGRELSVVTAAHDTARLTTLALAGMARRDTFAMDSLRLRGLDVTGHRLRLDADGRIVTGMSGDPDTAALELVWDAELADGRRAAGRGTVSGGSGDYRLRHRLSAPVAATLDATIARPWTPDSLRWRLVLDVPRAPLAAIRDGLAGDLELSVTGSGDLSVADATVAFRGAYPDVGPSAVDARLRYRDGVVMVDTLDLRRLDGPGAVGGRGRVELGDDGPTGVAVLAWRDLGWPLDASGTVSPAGAVRAEGRAGDFRASAELTLEQGGGDLGRWTIDTEGGYTDSLAVGIQWTGRRPGTRVSGSGRLGFAPGSGDIHSRILASVVVEGSPALELDGSLGYGLESRRLVVDTLRARLPATGGRLDLRASADLGEPGDVSARARWRDIGWPFDDPAYRSDAGELTVEGRGGDVRVEVAAEVGGTALPAGSWRLLGRGGASRFAVETLEGRLLDGTIRGSGMVWLDPQPGWELVIQGDSLNPGVWRDEWPGRLGFRLETDGRTGDAPSFRVRLPRLAGTLRGQSVTGSLAAEGTDGVTVLDSLLLQSGDATVTAAGAAGDSVDLDWRLDAPALGGLVPAATGSVTARGRVTGPRRTPIVSMTADGRELAAGGWSVERLVVDADVETAGTRSSSAALVLTGVTGPSMALDSLRLEGAGTPEDHTVTLVAGSPGDVVEGRAVGGVGDGAWRGRLQRLDLRSRRAGDWQLREPGGLDLARASGTVEGMCLEGTGELCVEGGWSDGGAHWRGTGRALPMAFFRPVLPWGLVLRGRFDFDTEGVTRPGDLPLGHLHLTADTGAIEYTGDQAVTRRYDGLAMEAVSDSAGADLTAELSLGSLGSATASARLTGAEPIRDRAIAGELELRLEDDGTVGRFVPGVAESRGSANVEVDASGTVAAPRLRGTVSLSDVGAVVGPAGIRLRNGRLEAQAAPSGRWELEGSVRSDTGRLEIAGTARPPDAEGAWLMDASIDGSDFLAFRRPDLMVMVTPRLEVRATSDTVAIDGRVDVPRARIAVRELEGTVDPSPDVVIVGVDSADAADATVVPAAVRGNVRVVLGDSVMVDALGLTGRLAGELTVRTEPGRPPLGNGELGINDGEYRIYRQTFQIDRGRLLYTNMPLTDPALDLRITRQGGDVVAGMEVGGRAADPRVELFSEPSLSDEEILAYLIAGRPLRRLSQSEGGEVRNMARSAGLAGGNLLLARLGTVFGLETVRLERTEREAAAGDPAGDDAGTGDTGDAGDAADADDGRQTSLVLGSRILPRVHLDYAIGLNGAANVVRLRYVISDHWLFRTENGAETGADLLYTIER